MLEQANQARSDHGFALHYGYLPFDGDLRAMQVIGQAFGVAVGYSDHTDGISPIAAVAMVLM